MTPEKFIAEPVDRPDDDRNAFTDPDLYPGSGEPGPDGPFTTLDTVEVIQPPIRPKEIFTPFDRLPELQAIEPPVYPRMVRDAGIDGTVDVRVLVGRNGRVKDAYVIDGSPALHAAALASVRTAVFKPALQGTQPVEVWVVMPVEFRLYDR